MSYKDEMAYKAQMHTSTMAVRYEKEIEEAIKNSVIYNNKNEFKKPIPGDTKIILEDLTTSSAIYKYIDMSKIAVLNFASYKNPGGYFIDGSMAQEEAICHDSFLYNVLKEFKSNYYSVNCTDLNRGLYRNKAIYSPNISFIHGSFEEVVDVITCASPNWNAAGRFGQVTEAENLQALKARIKFILDIAYENNVETLILGAFGCGVFKQDAKIVARIFNEYLKHYNFKKVIFAIPRGKDSYNYDAFESEFFD